MEEEKKKKITRALQGSQNRMELLCHSTEAEAAAYSIISRMGLTVIRQQPFYTGAKAYYADLYIPQLRLVVEIDGGYHFTSEQKRKDENRSAGLRRLGLHICRLTNHDARIPEKVRAKLLRFKSISKPGR